jgi:uncharacterized protein (DUF2336 family)
MSEPTNTATTKVEDLMKLAQDKNGRNDLFNNITAMMEARYKQISSAEFELMLDILGKLVHEVEISVRKNLAYRLADREDVPVELIILLANDEAEVANPILLQNTLLTDKELIRIIQLKTRQHQLGIAARNSISSDICRELVNTGDDGVIVTMLTNQSAKIDNESIEIIVEKSKTKELFQAPLIHRHDLPKDIAARMYGWVSLALKNELLDIHNFDREELEMAISASIDDLKSETANPRTQNQAEEKLIEKLYDANKLHPSFLMKSLSQGSIYLFEIGFAKMLRVPREVMYNILYEKGPDALAIACCAAKIDKSIFMTIFRLTREAKKMDTEISKDEIAHIYRKFADTDESRAKAIIHKWVEDSIRNPIF